MSSLRRFWLRSSHRPSSQLRRLHEQPRVNQVGIQYLSEGLHRKVFPTTSPSQYLQPQHPELLPAAVEHLKHNGLYGKKTAISKPIDIANFPPLLGTSLDEHFHKLGMAASQPYLAMAETLFHTDSQVPPIPPKWAFSAGWTRYAPGKAPEPVPFPREAELVFDVEVMYQRSHYAVMATCASTEAWYGWVSPLLVGKAADPSYDNWDHLIPFDLMTTPRLMVGYNVAYDRSRVLEEYNIKQSQAFFLDGMALHVAVAGICSQQRPKWNKHKKNKSALEEDGEDSESEAVFDRSSAASELASELIDDPWLNKGSSNSLANVFKFHLGQELDKADREFFSSEDPHEIIANFQKLMTYCAKDVEATFLVTKKLFPEFREKVPHPVSFGALRHMGSLILPTSTKWDSYVKTAEQIYQDNREEVSKILKERAHELIRHIEESGHPAPNYEDDPWLRQLDWTLKLPRLKKDGTPVANNAYLTGYPEWYRDLFKTNTVDGVKKRELNLSVRTRITPLLLRLKWEGYPLIWTNSAGWCFKVPHKDEIIDLMESKNYTRARLSEDDLEKYLPELRDNGNSFELFKIPHPDGPGKRTTSILSKGYLKFFEDGTLTSEYTYAQEILTLNNTASYWMGNRNRISSQFVVYSDKNDFGLENSENIGIILPKLCTMGTITRRATENTWLTASNAKKTRIGSELKSLIEAPKGYVFVGADVDSEELWIASLVGDSMFGMHGSTALGWMTLEGDKSEKTDLHSKTAEIMGISRGDAKVFNYGRIYGAGVKFATRLLKQCNSALSDLEAEEIAKKLYASTKGHLSKSTFLNGKLYHGGTESVMFNALEAIAHQENPRTPVLGASITAALTIENLNKNDYLTSRINWAIQSSGVDYLHLLVVSMAYLVEKYNIDARLAITVHDELRFLVREEDKYKAALLLQISNVWTRAMFCEQLGLNELPQNCAFFSEVDIDRVLRKEVTLDCVTPSQPVPIAPGESLSISKLLEAHGTDALASHQGSEAHRDISYHRREPVIKLLDKDLSTEARIAKTALQNAVDHKEWRQRLGDYIRVTKGPTSGAHTKNTVATSGTKITKKTENTKNTTSAKGSYHSATASTGAGSRKRPRVTEEYDISSDGTEELQKHIATGTRAKSPARPASDAPGASACKLAVKAGASRYVTDPAGPKKGAGTGERSGGSRLIRRLTRDRAGAKSGPQRPTRAPYPKVLRREDPPSYESSSSRLTKLRSSNVSMR